MPVLLDFLCLPFLAMLFVLVSKLEGISLQVKWSILHKTAALERCEDTSSLETTPCLLTRQNKVCDSCHAAGDGAQRLCSDSPSPDSPGSTFLVLISCRAMFMLEAVHKLLCGHQIILLV